MRIMFNTSGGYGHLYPLMPLVRALTAGGADVAVATPAYFTRPVADLGLTPLPLDAPGVAEPDLAYKEAQAAREPQWRGRFAVARFLEQAVLQTPALCVAAREWGADVIVRETTAYAAWLVGELLDIPVAVLDFTPTSPRVTAATLGDLFDDARTGVGLPTEHGVASLRRWLHLLALPPEWLHPSVLGPTSRVFRPAGDPGHAMPAPDRGVVQDNSRPLVYVTLGTVFNNAVDVFETIFKALAEEPVNVLATVGGDVDPSRFSGFPPHIEVKRFVPQSAVLDRAAAVVCHGGYGTVMGALRRGIPVVAIPIAGSDDSVNAVRLEASGAGVMLPEGRRASADVRRAVTGVLGESRYRAGAEAVARSIASTAPLEDAAPLIAGLADGGAVR